MSSGAQIEMDWAGIDVASGAVATPPVGGANGAGAGAEKYLTDEEILGIEPVGESTTTRRDVIPSGARNPSDGFHWRGGNTTEGFLGQKRPSE